MTGTFTLFTDWRGLVGTRLWVLLCDSCPGLLNALSRPQAWCDDVEWSDVLGKTEAVESIKRCNDRLPFGNDYDSVTTWLEEAHSRGFLGHDQHERLKLLLHDHLGF